MCGIFVNETIKPSLVVGMPCRSVAALLVTLMADLPDEPSTNLPLLHRFEGLSVHMTLDRGTVAFSG